MAPGVIVSKERSTPTRTPLSHHEGSRRVWGDSVRVGVINQLVRRPPIEVDLTLRAGNGGFVVLGAAMVFVALFSRVARNR
jgi:hypothetical protein